ncbi:MAG: hypothetical protein A3G81_20465 [Betaproteobacteria bacterium RIFCSPLOWO2_12_FULL_65_14]|nr:MAG: hypothetical protein A3G81_20465 [Betaproteobacteria bacterium RIFCSPLOWO2_12_FULL_65_14]
MGTVLEAAFEVQSFLVQAGERFCFIGALALQRWGEPRATRDVDLTLLCPFGAEAAAIVERLNELRRKLV